MFRSAASVLVGRPVDGPPRWMSISRNGSSSETAREVASLFSATPGPDVVVMPRCPANDAPMASAAAAISSSACTVRTPKFLCFESSCRMSLAGVIGYEPSVSGSLANWAAAINPQASAVLPLMFVYSPGGRCAGFTMKRWPNSSVVSP